MKPHHIHIVMFALVLVLLLGVMEPASAKDNISADQELAQKEGGLGSKEIDASKLPGALEYAILIGSVIAAIGVVKFA